jgi:hypothetical protein
MRKRLFLIASEHLTRSHYSKLWMGAEPGPHQIRAKYLQLDWDLQLRRNPIGADRTPKKMAFFYSFKPLNWICEGSRFSADQEE